MAEDNKTFEWNPVPWSDWRADYAPPPPGLFQTCKLRGKLIAQDLHGGPRYVYDFDNPESGWQKEEEQ